MFIRNWKKEILTVPNLLSLFRLGLLPVYVRVYLNAAQDNDYLIAGGLMAVSCLTDLLDGWIARKLDQVTTLGKILDPLADKITQFTLTGCLCLVHPELRPVLLLFVVKEIFQLVVGLAFLLRGCMLPGALMAGKVCTTVLFVSLIGLVLLPDLPSGAVEILAFVDGTFLLISFGSYLLAYFGRDVKVQKLDTAE